MISLVSGATCFPPGPQHHDKLAGSQPFMRAKDLEDMLTKVVLDAGKKKGNYENRIGEMGEFAFMEAARAACEELPGHPFLIITAYEHCVTRPKF